MSIQDDIYRKEYRTSSALFVVVAAMMAMVLLKTPANPARYLFLAIPYVFLWSLWGRFRNACRTIGIRSPGEDETGDAIFQRLRAAVQMQTLFGVAGIATALAMGFMLGRLG